MKDNSIMEDDFLPTLIWSNKSWLTWIVVVWASKEVTMFAFTIIPPSVIDNNSVFHWTAHTANMEQL